MVLTTSVKPNNKIERQRMLDPSQLNGPIPGQSLTGDPKAAAWERPPELNAPEEAAMWHLKRLRTEESVEATLDILELGVDVATLTRGILRGAVAEGIHSIDVSLLVAPIIHQSIVNAADKAGIDYDEGRPEAEDRTEIEYQINKRKSDQMVSEVYNSPDEVEPEPMLEEEQMVEGEPMSEEMPRGLMMPRGGLG